LTYERALSQLLEKVGNDPKEISKFLIREGVVNQKTIKAGLVRHEYQILKRRNFKGAYLHLMQKYNLNQNTFYRIVRDKEI